MIIYNVTTILEKGVEKEYVQFMQDLHMPEVMATGKFTNCNLFLLSEPENEGITYCAQYITDSAEKLEQYREEFAPKLKEHFHEKFANKFVSFRSVLHLIPKK